jgi:hypothetical protein
MKFDQSGAQQQTKKAYVTPKLIVYGDVEQITRTKIRRPNDPRQPAPLS